MSCYRYSPALPFSFKGSVMLKSAWPVFSRCPLFLTYSLACCAVAVRALRRNQSFLPTQSWRSYSNRKSSRKAYASLPMAWCTSVRSRFRMSLATRMEPSTPGYIWKFDPSTKETSIFRSPSGMSNGIKFDAAGNMIVAEGADYGGRRVTRTDMKTGKAKIIASSV